MIVVPTIPASIAGSTPLRILVLLDDFGVFLLHALTLNREAPHKPLFPLKTSGVKFLKSPLSGISPVSSLKETLKYSSNVSLSKLMGIEPEILLQERSKYWRLFNLAKESGIGPCIDKSFVNRLRPRNRYWSSRKLPRVIGMCPVNELIPSERVVSLERFETEAGIFPLNLLFPRFRNSRLGSPLPMEDGRFPKSSLYESSRNCNVEMLKTDDGTSPFSLLDARMQCVKLDKSPISEGIFP
ncbi:UNVERIFIED_CONTAM: hypothetical protein Slati_2106600 [Sesamum latifolium]|uniref:Uncharacterized protein n=1 Tax=Sesamum latifolium TaxID=2727402 RepID=A0AAW2WPC0_9LAMI